MIVPHAAHVGVSPQWEDLSNDGHPAQRAVNELHDICVAHFLKMERTERHISSVRTSVWLVQRECLEGKQHSLPEQPFLPLDLSGILGVESSACVVDQHSWRCRLPAGVHGQAGGSMMRQTLTLLGNAGLTVRTEA